jgi:CDP-6-deoxy-D-xylo-4-hexulose-3-dehydrase
MEIAERHNLFVLEDTCESHGATVDGKKVGTFGDMGTFSFFFSHHISTIEGGMVVTNNEEYAELAKSLRVFGWARSLKKYEDYARQNPHIDKRFLFVNKGFNFRPTEIHGAFGIHQMKKLERYIAIRKDNAAYWTKRFKEFSDYLIVHEERLGTRHVWFGQPVTVRHDAPFTRDELTKHLEDHKIETRPVQVSNIVQQPSVKFINHRVHGELKNAQYIMDHSFFFGNHQGIGKEEREYVADVIADFIEQKVKSKVGFTVKS